MKNRNIFSLVLICTMLLGACEKEIVFKGDVKQPMLTLNGFLTPDRDVSVHLSKSRFVFDEDASLADIENATVELYVNGTPKQKLTHNSNGWYKGTYRPRPEEEIEIRASAPGFNPIKARTVIPVPPALLLSDSAITYFYRDQSGFGSSGEEDQYKMLVQQNRVRLSLKEKADEENFYFMKSMDVIHLQNGTSYPNFHEVDIRKIAKTGVENENGIFDILFKEEDRSGEHLKNLFPDSYINGREIFFDFFYTDNIRYVRFVNGKEIPQPAEEMEKEYIVELSSMSKEYYLFLISSWKAEQQSDNPFAEPVQVTGNVENGAGILGSYATGRFTYRFKKMNV